MNALKALDVVLGSRKKALMFLNEAFSSFGLKGPSKFFQFLKLSLDHDNRKIWGYLMEANDSRFVGSILAEFFDFDEARILVFLRQNLYQNETDRFFEAYIRDYFGRKAIFQLKKRRR